MTNMNITDEKRAISRSHLCPEGLWIRLPQCHPYCPLHPRQPCLWCDPYGSRDTGKAKKKKINRRIEKQYTGKKVPGLPEEGGGQCSHELVKYSHSCQWFLMEALKSLGKALGCWWGVLDTRLVKSWVWRWRHCNVSFAIRKQYERCCLAVVFYDAEINEWTFVVWRHFNELTYNVAKTPEFKHACSKYSQHNVIILVPIGIKDLLCKL